MKHLLTWETLLDMWGGGTCVASPSFSPVSIVSDVCSKHDRHDGTKCHCERRHFSREDGYTSTTGTACLSKGQTCSRLGGSPNVSRVDVDVRL